MIENWHRFFVSLFFACKACRLRCTVCLLFVTFLFYRIYTIFISPIVWQQSRVMQTAEMLSRIFNDNFCIIYRRVFSFEWSRKWMEMAAVQNYESLACKWKRNADSVIAADFVQFESKCWQFHSLLLTSTSVYSNAKTCIFYLYYGVGKTHFRTYFSYLKPT